MTSLSIVIPVYNGQGSISRCLDSIWSQELRDYEVLCVDDCSTDATFELLSQLATSNPNLRVLHNSENLRAGGARNLGVREARGEYIVFIDADDYFHAHALQQAIDYVKGNSLDILMCDNVRHSLDRESSVLTHNFENQAVMSGLDFIATNGLPWAPWKYIFKRSLMVDNSVWFIERVSCEDVDWSHKLPFFAHRMAYSPILLTHFIINENSQTATEFRNKDIIWHRLYCARRIYELCSTLYQGSPELWGKLKAVSSMQFHQGVLYLNSFAMKLSLKRNMLLEYIPKEQALHPLVKFAARHPMLYAIGSNILSPLFRMVVVAKRKIYKRR
ncbi:MAG: glycosyltransferase family 2 protein [Rikenellaceae bacterium]